MSFFEATLFGAAFLGIGWLLREETIVGKFCKNPTKVVAWLEARRNERNAAID